MGKHAHHGGRRHSPTDGDACGVVGHHRDLMTLTDELTSQVEGEKAAMDDDGNFQRLIHSVEMRKGRCLDGAQSIRIGVGS